MSYRTNINQVQDNELVNASVTGRPVREVQGNVNYLKELYEGAFIGQAVVARGQIIEADALKGHAVWLNEATGRFERALLGVETDPLTGELVTTDRSKVWGIVLNKLSSTSADIVVAGLVDLDVANMIQAGHEAQAGCWYLSSTVPGQLIYSKSPAGVAVLMMGAESAADPSVRQIYVRPEIRDPLSGHRHYRFELKCRPAGDYTPPDTNDPHEITNPNDSIEGWLPASSFGDLAPAGAMFGYNIAQSNFAALWPPLPLQHVELTLSRGEDIQIQGCVVPSGPDQPLVIDENGIWWMLDCYNQVPWPTNWGSEGSGSADTECPILPPMQAILSFTRINFYSAITAVLSLTAKTGSGLRIYCRSNEEPAQTGHLEIDLELDFTGSGDEEPGYLVFKDVEGTAFKRGPVVSALVAGTSNVTLTGTTGLAAGQKVGVVAISVADRVDGIEYPVTTMKLNRTTLEYVEEVMAVGFSSTIESSFRGEIVIPTGSELPAGTKMKLTCLVLGRSAGTVAADIFTASYRRIAYPANSTPVVLPTTDTEITFTAGATLAGANRYFKGESEEFTVAAGDTIQFTIQRDGSDGYSADLLLFRLRGQLVLEE